MPASRIWLAVGLALALAACDDDNEHADGGDASMRFDGGTRDAGRDATVSTPDGSARMDAATDGAVADGAMRDGATGDGGAGDGGTAFTGFTLLYFEDFESSMAWSAGGTNSTWQWGTPAGTRFTHAYSGGNAWETNLTGDYDNDEESWVESPAIDLSAATGDVLVRLAIQYDIEPGADGAWLEVSTDGGTTWTKVGAMGEGASWYDTDANWWTGPGIGWRLAQIPVTGVTGMSDVRFRVRFMSNVAEVHEGFVFDDFAIIQGTDLSVTATGLPTVCGTRVIVTNVGSTSVSSFTLTTVTDGTSSTDTVSMPLAPYESYGVTVSGRMVSATVSATGDMNAIDDTASRAADTPLGTSAYMQGFESGAAGWFSTGVGTFWELGMPSGTFISRAATGSNAWVTNLGGEYRDHTTSYLESPCIDMSAATTDPTLSFALIYQTESCCDFAWVELSTDGGATWNKVGASGGGTHWYNDLTRAVWEGDSGAAGAWETASHALTGAAGNAQVRIRYVFTSDESNDLEGVGVDDVTITP